MTDSLFTKLQSFDAALQTVLKRYDNNNSELQDLKSQPHIKAADFNDVKQQLTEAMNLNKRTAEENENLQRQFTDLGKEYETLAEAYHDLNNEHNELIKKCATLEKENHVLQEKNHTASEHAKVILERLTRIDQAGS